MTDKEIKDGFISSYDSDVNADIYESVFMADTASWTDIIDKASPINLNSPIF
jgi:hypothetical protein